MATPIPAAALRDAVQQYANIDRARPAGDSQPDGAGFGATLTRAMGDVIGTSRTAEDTAMRGIAGNANITDVVTAVSKAELALQTTTTVRDRVVQAYQDIMRMPI